MNLFDFNRIGPYLQGRLEPKSGGTRGVKSQFAKAIQCDAAYVSRILMGSNPLSLEQGMRANRYFGHTVEEGDYFLTLIGLSRAGSKELEQYYESKREQLQKQHLNLSQRLKTVEGFSEENQARYYSYWLYTAVDMATSIPSLQTVPALSAYFALPPQSITPILEFLAKLGVVIHKNGCWVNTNQQIHLGDNSPHLRKHHLNWRLKAMQLIEANLPENLHYSSVVSISKKDYDKLKEQLISAIGALRKTVRESGNEILASYCVDLFKL